MKTRGIILVLALGLMISAFGQKATMELTFTAEDNGQNIPLNSILIENLTQGGDTTLYAPDTVLVLDYVTSIENSEVIGKRAFVLSQNYPNPFKGKTEFNLYLPEKENIKITGRDIIGRELVQYENMLSQGNHTFSFYAGNESYYLLTVTGKQASQTIKMLNAGSTTTISEKCKLVYTGNNENVSGYKSQKAINGFSFNIGDELKYISFSDIGERTIIDSPTGDQTYTFQYGSGGTPCPGMPTITDIDGNTYNTVQIGDQCWMKENLNVGTMIPGGDDMTDNGTIEKYCHYNDPANCSTYGGLYQWYEMMQYVTQQGVQGICPDGWHIPSDAEWCIVTQEIDPTVDCDVTVYSGTDIGTKMKSTTGWNSNGNGTNESGFSALPGGFRNYYGDFGGLGYNAFFWSSTGIGSNIAWGWRLSYTTTSVGRGGSSKLSGFSVRCVQDFTSATPPEIETGSVSNITSGSAYVDGEIIDLGGSDIIQHGHCWSTEPNPTVDDFNTELGSTSTTGSFTSSLTELEPETTYYVKAYAINSEGTAYGEEVSFVTLAVAMGEPCPGTPTVDWQGQTYNTVQIGDQCWMQENLNWETGNSWCYDDETDNCDTYGRLYDWETIMNGAPSSNTVPSGVQGICPTGWHIPSDAEWCIVTQEIDPTVDCDVPGWSGSDAGTKMKSTTGWNSNGNGTNESGFTALPGGTNIVNFSSLGYEAYFWSSTEHNSDNAWYRTLEYIHFSILRNDYNKNYGFSVRCVQD